MMPITLQYQFGLWRETRRRRRAEREAFLELNDHLLRDIGLQPRRSAGDPWL